MKMQRDLLRKLFCGAFEGSGASRVWVGNPGRLIDQAAGALGIDVEGRPFGPSVDSMVRIHFKPIIDLFVRRGITLLRWTKHTEQGQGPHCLLEIVLPSGSDKQMAPAIAESETAIKSAFGGTIDVRVVRE